MLDLRTTKNPRGLGERIGNALTYIVKMRLSVPDVHSGTDLSFHLSLHAHVRA